MYLIQNSLFIALCSSWT